MVKLVNVPVYVLTGGTADAGVAIPDRKRTMAALAIRTRASAHCSRLLRIGAVPHRPLAPWPMRASRSRTAKEHFNDNTIAILPRLINRSSLHKFRLSAAPIVEVA